MSFRPYHRFKITPVGPSCRAVGTTCTLTSIGYRWCGPGRFCSTGRATRPSSNGTSKTRQEAAVVRAEVLRALSHSCDEGGDRAAEAFMIWFQSAMCQSRGLDVTRWCVPMQPGAWLLQMSVPSTIAQRVKVSHKYGVRKLEAPRPMNVGTTELESSRRDMEGGRFGGSHGCS